MSVRLPTAHLLSANLRLSGYGSDQAGAMGGPTRRFDRFGSRHSLDITLGVQRGACAAALYAARLKARTNGDTLIMDFPRLPKLVNAIAGVQVDGADQLGNSLAVRGLPVRSRTNLLIRSQEFDNAAWGKSGAGTGSAPVVTANAQTAPDGTTTADSVVFDQGAGITSLDQSVLSQAPDAVIGLDYSFSIWLKAPSPVTIRAQTTDGELFGLLSVTTNWLRYTITGSAVSAMPIILLGKLGDAAGSSTVYLWGAQFEQADAASDYIATTSAPVTASSPLISARKNLLAHSQDFESWTPGSAGTGSNPVVTADIALAPDGTMTADKLVFDQGSGVTSGDQSVLTISATTLAGVTDTLSIWLRADTPAQIRMQTGSSEILAVISVTRNWERYTASGIPVGSSTIVYLGKLGDGAGESEVYAWAAQLEQGAAASDYIPTDGSAVTDYADLIPPGSPMSLVVDGLNYLYITADVVPDSGDATQAILLDCQLRASPADSAAIEFAKPQIEGYVSGTDEAWMVNRTVADGLGFTLAERA